MAGMRIATFVAAILLTVAAGPAAADHKGEVNVMGAFPQGEFKDQIAAGIGLSGGYTWGFFSGTSLSLRVGLNGGFIIYGNETRQEPFSTTIPDVTVEVTTSNNIGQFGTVAQLAATQGSLRPYFEARAGFSYFYTQTSIKDIGGDGEDIASSKNFDDTTGYTAFGGGMLFPVYRREIPGQGDIEVSIDLKFLYWRSGEAEYLKEGSIRRENGSVAYNIIHSGTDMTTAHLGVAVIF